MKLVYCKMASNRLADNYREDGVARPYTRRPIDYELSNLLDDVPEHLELCFDFVNLRSPPPLRPN